MQMQMKIRTTSTENVFKMTKNQSTIMSLIIKIVLTILLINQITVEPVVSSGVFEINFSSLVDAFGRDLRDDCCSWQNQSSQGEAADLTCDPKKCQLIVRICVKNYQSQDIESSQCTFGELTAQVSQSSKSINNHLNNHLDHHHHHQLDHLINRQPLNSKPLAKTAAISATSTPTINTNNLGQQLTSNKFNVHFQKYQNHQQQQHHHQHQHHIQNQQQSNHIISQQQHNNHLHHQRSQQQQQHQILPSSQARALRQINFRQSISFPFNFTWPGSYSLVVDAWYESPTGLQQVAMPNYASMGVGSDSNLITLQQQALGRLPPMTLFDLYRKQLIIHHSIRGWLPVREEWTNELHKTELATLAYSYRVTCQQNYYGDHCNLLCRPRDDIYGHYTCSQSGSVQCLPGWQGPYCLEPICLAGCHREHGNCSRPSECNCRFGWKGSTCDLCIAHPGCVNGYCNKPHECICEEGWSGPLCNEPKNVCSTQQPCQNGASCLNSIDASGRSSYTCNCPLGFTGKNCEKRTSTTSTTSETTKMQSTNSLTSQNNQVVSSGSNNNSSSLNQKKSKLIGSNVVASVAEQQQAAPGPFTPFFPQPISALESQQQQQQSSLERWLPQAYMVIIVCLIVLVALLLLRLVLERPNLRQAYGWWMTDGHHGSNHGVVQVVDDVATMQNHQNIYKSRASLRSTEKMGYDSVYGSMIDSCGSTGDGSSQDRTLPRPANPHHLPPQHHRSYHQLMSAAAAANQNHAIYASRQQLHHSYHNLAMLNQQQHQQQSSSSTANLAPPPPYQSVAASSRQHSQPQPPPSIDYVSTHHVPLNYSTYGTHSLYGIPAAQSSNNHHRQANNNLIGPTPGRRALSQARIYSTNHSTYGNNTASTVANNNSPSSKDSVKNKSQNLYSAAPTAANSTNNLQQTPVSSSDGNSVDIAASGASQAELDAGNPAQQAAYQAPFKNGVIQ